MSIAMLKQIWIFALNEQEMRLLHISLNFKLIINLNTNTNEGF